MFAYMNALLSDHLTGNYGTSVTLGFLIRYLIVCPPSQPRRLQLTDILCLTFIYCAATPAITEAPGHQGEGHPPPNRALICLVIIHILILVR